MGPIIAHVWVKLSHKNGVITVVTKLSSSVCHDDRHFGMVKATGLQIVTLRLPLMA
jgi:pantothenate synthetase